MHRRWVAAVSLLLAFGLLGGCGFKDLDKRFFVIAVGIDPGQRHKYEVTLKLAIPSPRTEPGESKSQLVSEEGDSIAEAVRLMKSKIDKEFDFGQARIIVVGRPFLDKSDVGRSLDWAFRRRDMQEIAYLAVGEPNAREVLEIKPKSERTAGNDMILTLSRAGTESPYVTPIMLFDYYRRLRDEGSDPYLPVVKIGVDTLVMDHTVLIRKDRMALELSSPETLILGQLLHNYQTFLIEGDVRGKSVSFNGTRMKVNYRILTPRNETPVIRYKLRFDVFSEESQTTLFGLKWKEIEQAAEEAIEEQTMTFLRKLQKNGVDPLGFGIRYRATQHHGDKEYEEWQQLYPQVRFEVRASATMRSTGIIE